MRQQSIANGISIAMLLVVMSAGRTFGGFVDHAAASEKARKPTVENYANTNTRENESTPALTFDVNMNAEDRCNGEQAKLLAHAPTNLQQAPPAVTAPLPDALLPGLVMIAGAFIATRILKRRLV